MLLANYRVDAYPVLFKIALLLVINLFLFNPAYGEPETHSGDTTGAVKRREAEEIKKLLEDSLKKETERKEATPLKSEDGGTTENKEPTSLPVSISVLALRLDNGTTPKALFDAVELLKKAETKEEIEAASKILAQLLKKKIRELYGDEDGNIDFEQLFKDLTLEDLEHVLRKKILKESIEELLLNPTPLTGDNEEDPTEGDPNDPNNPNDPADPNNPDGPIDVEDFQQDPGDGILDPTEDDLLGDDFLADDELNPDIIDDELGLDENNQNGEDGKNGNGEDGKNGNNANGKDGKNGKNDVKNGKNGANGKGAKAPETPPTPPSIPSLGGGGSGSGGGQPPETPKAPEIPKGEVPPQFQMPPIVQESPLSNALVSALLAKDKDKGDDKEKSGSSFDDILASYAKMNEIALQTILQTQAQLMSTIANNRAQPGLTVNQGGVGVGAMAQRLQTFNTSSRGNTSARGPRTQRNPISGLGNGNTSPVQTSVPTSSGPKRYLRGRLIKR